jgi:hypothetical protein
MEFTDFCTGVAGFTGDSYNLQNYNINTKRQYVITLTGGTLA